MASEKATQWEREQFFEAASVPEFPNRMAFEVGRSQRDKDATFSKEAISTTTENIQAFVLARVLGEWKKKGIAPQEMNIEVTVKFDQNKGKRKLEQGNIPWWNLDDPELGMTDIDSDTLQQMRILDGEHR